MITFCINDGAKSVDQDDFELLLSAVQGESLRGRGEMVQGLGQPI
jgi:hypothetical protein